VETSNDCRAVFDRLLREGAIVRPLGPFGADEAIRVTVGTREENEFFAAGLERVLQGARTSF
jgi:histidinol-phosphate aminotransferase